jgi:hypothetical protein
LQANVNKLDQKRRLRFEKMDKIFHDLEVVPLFGDMQVRIRVAIFSNGFLSLPEKNQA